MSYNYQKFNNKEYDFSVSRGLQVGDIVPNYKLRSQRGDEINLFNEKNKIMVLETGSMTCPLYSGNIKQMDHIAAEYPEIEFRVIYVREAHPGKIIPCHANIDSKIEHSNSIKKYFPENRLILIDSIDGVFHQHIGLLPNTVLVIGKNKEVLYKMDWNHPGTLKKVLDNLVNNKPVNNIVPKFLPAPFSITIPVLLRSGGDALFDFLINLPGLILERAKKFTKKGGQF